MKVAGVDLSAKGDVLLSGQSVAVSGVIDSVSFDEVMRTKKSGLLSKKVTTTTTALDQERWWPRRSAATG